MTQRDRFDSAVIPVARTWSGSRTAGLASTLTWLVPLAMILAVATFARTVDLNVLGYNSDEAVYAGQAASIAQVPVLTELFPLFRAHPLLFQFILALFYAYDSSDLMGRQISAALGVATVALVFSLGNHFYGRRAGLIAAALLAVMPYHVVPTRQVLLDGTMTLYATLTLYLFAQYAATERPEWLYATSVGMGLTFLAKETGILFLGAIYAFLALSPEIRVRIRDIFISLMLMVAAMLPYPLAVSLAGGKSGGTTQQYLVWQLFRRPNHAWDFYPTMVPPAIGFGILIAALAGLWLLRHKRTWRERMLLTWILVPVVFFQLWPTKGFQYLLPIAPPLAILAARTLCQWPIQAPRCGRLHVPQVLPGMILAVAIAASLIPVTWARTHPYTSDAFLAGSGGVPGGRELGSWIKQNVPEGAHILTIGPSMANIVRYYGHREAYGLSVSPNPLHRNPSYEPIHNPDFMIRTAELQYLVWDSFSAGRSTFFSDALLYYANKYGGRILHEESVVVETATGEQVERPVIIVYEVHPQW